MNKYYLYCFFNFWSSAAVHLVRPLLPSRVVLLGEEGSLLMEVVVGCLCQILLNTNIAQVYLFHHKFWNAGGGGWLAVCTVLKVKRTLPSSSGSKIGERFIFWWRRRRVGRQITCQCDFQDYMNINIYIYTNLFLNTVENEGGAFLTFFFVPSVRFMCPEPFHFSPKNEK